MCKGIVLIQLLMVACLFVNAQPCPVKVIDLGWNYRDVSQLKTELPGMQNPAFDGVVCSIQRYPIRIFDTTPLSDEYFQFETLSQLNWGKLTDNFIYTWGSSTLGGSWP